MIFQRNFLLDENKLENLLNKLKKQCLWWENIINDKDLYIDIRKGNELNVYYNGGSILRINSSLNKIYFNYQYLPLKDNYLPLKLTDNNIKEQDFCINIDFNNFDKNIIKKIKNRITKYYPSSSEKGIQGKYELCQKEKMGFFVDTEYAYKYYDEKERKPKTSRIDLVYYHIKTNKLYFVELKTIEDSRLCIKEDDEGNLIEVKSKDKEPINEQLKKYHKFIKENKSDLKEFYKKIIRIKSKFGLLRNKISEFDLDKLEDMEIEEKPILLIGNTSTNFMKKYDVLIKKHESIFFNEIFENCCYRVYRHNDTNYINLGNCKNIYPSPVHI